jgi:peptidoglycan/LPS O-acetylase OafA/YrhL
MTALAPERPTPLTEQPVVRDGACGAAVSGTRHVPALDGMRGLAVLVVMTLHTFVGFPTDGWLGTALRVTTLGWVGVDLFFVLSGFLITGLLLDARGTPGYYRSFYARRALRIWPLYFGVICVLTVISWARPNLTGGAGSAFLRNWSWYWTHTTNVQIALFGWSETSLAYLSGHFWSLGVEEQFYLAWPLVVAVAGPHRLPRVCGLLWLVAVAARIALVLAGDRMSAIYTLPVTRLDGLLAGAVLACVMREEGGPRRIARWVAPLVASNARLGVATAGWLTALMFATGSSEWPIQRSAFALGWPPIAALGGAAMLAAAITRPPGTSTGVLMTPALRGMGRIGYGLYVLHPLVLWLVSMLAGTHAPSLPLLAQRAVVGLTTLAAAWVSWRYWERPWLGLRARLPRATRVDPTRPPRDAADASAASPRSAPGDAVTRAASADSTWRSTAVNGAPARPFDP